MSTLQAKPSGQPSSQERPSQRELNKFSERFSAGLRVSGGGMSDVYAGLDLESGSKVALKVASSASIPLELANRYIEREKLALGKIRHPNVVSLLGSGEIDGHNYLALEFVEGQSLGDRIKDRSLCWRDARAVLLSLCDALDASHAGGAVHADLSASNVFLSRTPSGEERTVLLDFGFVKFMDGTLNEGRTPGEDVILGTFKYLAPEQAFRSIAPDFDHRADIYSFGVLAYRMLGGFFPFDGPSDYSILVKHRDEPPRPLSGIPDLPPEADRLIIKALAKDPAARHQSAAELKKELESVPG